MAPDTTTVYADWCGPCKMIAPTFESLANKFAKPNRIAFAKVDVDNQRDVAQQYGVRAMPTFVILRNGSVLDTIQGANPPALTAAVEKAVKLATGGGASFSTPGRTLASSSGAATSGRSAPIPGNRVGAGSTTGGGGPIQGRESWLDLRKIFNFLTMFFGLYITSLFSVSPGPPPHPTLVFLLLYCFIAALTNSSTRTWRRRTQSTRPASRQPRSACRRAHRLAAASSTPSVPASLGPWVVPRVPEK
jgi:thioredoxin 1